MNVGLVYDLRSERLAAGLCEAEPTGFGAEEAVDALRLGLEGLGFQVEAVGSARSLAAALARGRRWDLVFNTA